jgi:hypothetical protein
MDRGWHEIPQTPEAERKIARLLDRESLDDFSMDCRSLIPQLNDLTCDADELPELRDLDEALNSMNGEEIQQYRALLEIARPYSVSSTLRLLEKMGFYEVETRFADPAAYGREVAEQLYHLDSKSDLTKFIDFAGYGKARLSADGYEATRYGAVNRNAMLQKHLAGLDTIHSGNYYCD